MDQDEARNRMINIARHRGLAGPDLDGGLAVPLELHRVRNGWVGSASHPDGTEVRLHVADGDDIVEEWPIWPVGRIEGRLAEARADDRFPPYVTAVLEESGWTPGRRLPTHVLDGFAAEVAAIGQQDSALHLHRAARVAVQEFGGLALPAWRAPAVLVAPVAGHRWVAPDADLLQEIHGQPFSAVAVGRGGEYVMARDGWCVNLTPNGEFWGGVSFDDTLTRAVSGRGTGAAFDHTKLPRLLAAGRLARGR